MFKGKLKSPIFLFYLLITYITIQFAWWLYLIFSLYGKIYVEPEILNKKIVMLAGEGIVFILVFILGIFVIRRAFKRERELNLQQENFLLSVSHELKTPISSIQLFLQTLKKRDLDASKRDEIYKSSLGEVNRLDHLVSNLLLTRSISNNNFFLNKINTRVDLLIEDLIDQYKLTLLKEHEISISLESSEAEIDKEAFHSILDNLLSNSVKYAPRKSLIALKLMKRRDGIQLEISDEGPGIDFKQRDNVFQKFFRIENEMTRKSKGTGLGLYIAKHLVESHGGTITLKDNKPQGLKIEIIFK